MCEVSWWNSNSKWVKILLQNFGQIFFASYKEESWNKFIHVEENGGWNDWTKKLAYACSKVWINYTHSNSSFAKFNTYTRHLTPDCPQLFDAVVDSSLIWSSIYARYRT